MVGRARRGHGQRGVQKGGKRAESAGGRALRALEKAAETGGTAGDDRGERLLQQRERSAACSHHALPT